MLQSDQRRSRLRISSRPAPAWTIDYICEIASYCAEFDILQETN